MVGQTLESDIFKIAVMILNNLNIKQLPYTNSQHAAEYLFH
jgi:hypothetical protein